MITDAAIRAELKAVERGAKTSASLTDPGVRGAGRLMARIVQPGRVEWFAQTIEGGRRSLRKLGQWPAMTVAQARAAFALGPTPSKVAAEAPRPAPGATLADLVAGYLAHLEKCGKATKQPRALLEEARDAIGPDKAASDVTPADIVSVIRPIYDRGAPVQADKLRTFLSAAFNWGMKAEHDYRVKERRRWGLDSNPVAAVPRDTESDRVGERWLSSREFVDLLHWATATESPSRRAVALLMLTGQRVHEIIDLRPAQWDGKARLLSWAKTKNGLPHVVPVCAQAAAILDRMEPNAGGWLFASRTDPHKPLTDGGVLRALEKYAARWKVPPFTGRDLRRTWKTLAGEAGLTKTERDLLQNHTEGSGDVSSRHYDRWSYMTEKQAAVAKWEAWVAEKLREAARPRADLISA